MLRISSILASRGLLAARSVLSILLEVWKSKLAARPTILTAAASPRPLANRGPLVGMTRLDSIPDKMNGSCAVDDQGAAGLRQVVGKWCTIQRGVELRLLA